MTLKGRAPVSQFLKKNIRIVIHCFTVNLVFSRTCLSSIVCYECIVDKQCVLEQKLLLTTYRKSKATTHTGNSSQLVCNYNVSTNKTITRLFAIQIAAEPLYNTPLVHWTLCLLPHYGALAWKPSQGTKLYCLVNTPKIKLTWCGCQGREDCATDGRTDGRTVRAMHIQASRGKGNWVEWSNLVGSSRIDGHLTLIDRSNDFALVFRIATM